MFVCVHMCVYVYVLCMCVCRCVGAGVVEGVCVWVHVGGWMNMEIKAERTHNTTYTRIPGIQDKPDYKYPLSYGQP